MNFSNVISRCCMAATVALLVLATGSCRVSYKLNGASISPLAKTFSVSYFPNNATMVAPILSASFTDGLKQKFLHQTRLRQVNDGGDLHLEGEITNYTSTPAAITGNETPNQYRLTITVRVRFTNSVEPQYSFDKTFSNYADYNANILLQQAEPQLIPQIIEKLTDDIFNSAAANW